MYLELIEEATDDEVAEVFCSDESGKMSVSVFRPDMSIEDAMERLLFLAKIDRGVQQADSGQTISRAQVKERMAKWLK